jgi:biopolymer transport protein ExbD
MRGIGFYPSRRVAARGNRFLAELNVWPLVGILIVLLGILMVLLAPTSVF